MGFSKFTIFPGAKFESTTEVDRSRECVSLKIPLIIFPHWRLWELKFFLYLNPYFSVTRSMMSVIAFSRRIYTFIQVVKFSKMVLGKVYVPVQGVLINLRFLKNSSIHLQLSGLRLKQIFICSLRLFTACNVSFDFNKSLSVEYVPENLKKFLMGIFRMISAKLS